MLLDSKYLYSTEEYGFILAFDWQLNCILTFFGNPGIESKRRKRYVFQACMVSVHVFPEQTLYSYYCQMQSIVDTKTKHGPYSQLFII